MVKMRLNIRIRTQVNISEKYDNEAVRNHLVKIFKQIGQLSAPKESHLFKKEQKDPTFEPEMTITIN
jgi:hypothetical protein